MALNCVHHGNRHLYCYTAPTNTPFLQNDVPALFHIAAKDKAQKLVVFGGIHGYVTTGIPTGQTLAEKGVSNFSLDDRDLKNVGTGINFTYNNVAKLTTNGSDVSAANLAEVQKTINGYLDGGWYVLLGWCYSDAWATACHF